MTLQEIELRTLDYASGAEVLEYLRLFWEISLEQNEYATRRSPADLATEADQTRKTEDETNTYAGIGLYAGEIVGLHLLRRYVEWEQVGVHVAGLWVHPDFRRMGIATEFKRRGENWARAIGAAFINTNVHVGNRAMLTINANSGFTPFRINMRKRL